MSTQVLEIWDYLSCLLSISEGYFIYIPLHQDPEFLSLVAFVYVIIQLMTFHKVDTVIYQPRGPEFLSLVAFVYVIIQLMTFHKVDTMIYQPRGSDVHRSQWLR